MQDGGEHILHGFPEDEDEDSDLPDFSSLLNMALWNRTEEEEGEVSEQKDVKTAELEDPKRKSASDLWKGSTAVSPGVSAPVVEKVPSVQIININEAPAKPRVPAAASAPKAKPGKSSTKKRKNMERESSDPDFLIPVRSLPAKKTRTYEDGSSTGDINAEKQSVTKTRTTRPRRAKKAVQYLLDSSSDEDMFF